MYRVDHVDHMLEDDDLVQAIALSVIENALEYFEECPDDFVIQHVSDGVVFGSVNRLRWTARGGYAPDPSHCTPAFLKKAAVLA